VKPCALLFVATAAPVAEGGLIRSPPNNPCAGIEVKQKRLEVLLLL